MPNEHYAIESLAATGFVVCDGFLARKLRPDLYMNRIGEGFAATVGRVAKERGARLYQAKTGGVQTEVLVYALSENSLAQRLEWVTGLQVHEVIPAAIEQEAPVPERVTGTNRQHEARASRRRALEVLAAQPLQKYECNQNREILAARREIEMAGHSVSDSARTT